ncbi:50S ribosomal protein L6 [Patescibacteria group bacterium]|nr:50S ribosomal protein L6 [Patescibacteria group bacterium]MBU4353271.1 50S ribosomal protein L6 [Patescibacteria group bacterium]
MSRIGKKPILIPEKVEVKIDGGIVAVKGPLGEMQKSFRENDIEIAVKDGCVVLNAKRKSRQALALWGTYASHIKNMIEGVTKGFEKKLVIEGIGYRAQMEGLKLLLNLGLSHPVKAAAPDGVKAQVEKNVITISGVDKEKVGQFSAEIRALKKPEPYKGKGIRYENEIVRRKTGKKAAA